jgi:hypothetical protein
VSVREELNIYMARIVIKDKDELHTFICVALRNFIFGHIINNRYKKDLSLPKTVTFDTGLQKETFDITPLFSYVTTGKLISPIEVSAEFTKSLSRLIIKETYELIKIYCKETAQIEILKDWQYHNFNRVIRNCTSHGNGGTLNKWPDDLSKKGITSVTWKNKKNF